MGNRILVVDDDEATLQSVSRVFTLEGHEVLEASEGESALALTEGQMPDLVVLDVMFRALMGSRCAGTSTSSGPPCQY